jgi:hypothetical protein
VRSINDGVVGSEKKGTQGRDEILVPLTTSLYVKGRLVDREKVLVDVGTGYYVEKVGFPSFTFGRPAGELWFLGMMLIFSLLADGGKGDRVLRAKSKGA